MGRPYSTDLRERVLRACEVGDESQAAIARRFEISESAVDSWLRQLRRDGQVQVPQEGQDKHADVAEGVDGVRDPLCNVGEGITHHPVLYTPRGAPPTRATRAQRRHSGGLANV